MRTPDKYDKAAAQAAFDRIARLTRENGGGTFQRHTGAPVFVADAPENAVVWAHGEAFCPDCGAPLSDIGSVRYFEQYDAALGQSPYGECVEYASYTVEQTVYCSACGAPLGFEDVVAFALQGPASGSETG